jgi:putative methylase
LRVKRKDLEIFLTQLEKVPNLKLQYEQYPTPPRVAANLLWIAGIENNDLFNKTILDLGCGSGILALGTLFLGAREIVGIDIDLDSLEVAKRNSELVGYQDNCHWLCARTEKITITGIDTVVMNPPFGMRKESVSRDRYFLEKALELASVVYSINPYADKTREFFIEYCKGLNATIEQIIQMNFEIKKEYDFHKKEKHITLIDLYVIRKNSN